MKVAVLAGGASLEREISLRAGHACAEALESLGHETVLVDAGPDLASDLRRIGPDVAFNALHGRWGEDGCVQGLLEWLRIPYTHSGVLASALAMEKDRTKLAYAAGGIPFPDWRLATPEEISAAHVMEPPYVVKPRNEGSSLGGFHLVLDGDDPPAIADDDRDVFLVERFIPGRELTVAVLSGRAIAVSEFEVGQWYDFDAKYAPEAPNRVLPAPIPDDIYRLCLDLSAKAHAAIGCRGLTRTDFRWDESRGADGLFAIETNTQPGLRPDSNAGQQLAHDGMGFEALCQHLLEDASLDR